jgi:hypothetical protein
MEVRQTNFSSILQTKFCDVETGRLWSVDNNDNDETSPSRNVVEERRNKFSYLLHIFRIFLLVYHSVTWNQVLETTGESRQQKYEEIDVCD